MAKIFFVVLIVLVFAVFKFVHFDGGLAIFIMTAKPNFISTVLEDEEAVIRRIFALLQWDTFLDKFCFCYGEQ